jgi:hypothetical protein
LSRFFNETKRLERQRELHLLINPKLFAPDFYLWLDYYGPR